MSVRQVLIYFIIIITLSLVSCARVGRPTGGKKDKLPPVTISATPNFGSVNYKGNKIKISFDEYIKFKDLNKQLVISPPMNYSPIISPIGYPSKYITIKIKDTLKENTTYTFNFGNAIIDNAEGNPLKRFKYILSTGSYIDSLSVSGEIQDAFLQKTKSNISILLYVADSTFYDSIIYHKKPDYITNTLDSIGFTISNLKDSKYFLYALDDLNNNLLFNPKDEKIAFLGDSFDINKDSIYQLRLFKENPEFSIVNISQASKNHIVLGYEGSLETPINELVDKNNNTIDFISYQDKKTDSIHIWHKDINTDSIFIKAKNKDTIITKSIRLRSKEVDSIQLNTSINKILHFNDSLFIVSNLPITSIDNKLVKLMKNDSLEIDFTIKQERLNEKFLIDFNKEENTNYKVSLLPGAVIGFLAHENDSLQFKFKTKKKDFYGEIIVSVKTEGDKSLILELITEKGTTIKRVFLGGEKEVLFNFLKPDKYKLRLIIDENDNSIWDSGNVLKKQQPEKVIYFHKIIEVRSNWSISEEFIIN